MPVESNSNQEEDSLINDTIHFLKNYISSLDKNLELLKKYGMPFFYYRGKMFCYIWKDKKTKEPYLGFMDGNKLTNVRLEAGNRSRVKILRVNPNIDIDIKVIKEIVFEAIKTHDTN